MGRLGTLSVIVRQIKLDEMIGILSTTSNTGSYSREGPGGQYSLAGRVTFTELTTFGPLGLVLLFPPLSMQEHSPFFASGIDR